MILSFTNNYYKQYSKIYVSANDNNNFEIRKTGIIAAYYDTETGAVSS